jgi:hypothetical protein
MTRKIKDTIKQAALWLFAIVAALFITGAVLGAAGAVVLGAIQWLK